jgi:phage terminase small subunit
MFVITVDIDRDLYTRHGVHLNAHGKEQVANKIAAAVNKLFSQKVSPVIALKWKQQEDLASYLNENQSQSVNIEIPSQTYQKDASVNHVECDELTVLSEENRVSTTQVPKGSSCTVK